MTREMETRFQSVIAWIRALHDAPCAIVGGAVRDTLLGREPKDWDLFYLSANHAALKDQFANCPYAENMDRPFARHSALAAELSAPFGAVQVFSTPYATLRAILQTSDWNVSAFGFDGRLEARERLENIAPGKPLKLLHVSNPICTLKRGFDFEKRFEMELDSITVVRLCRIIADKSRHRRIDDPAATPEAA